MARNDDRARARRAKRRGEDPSEPEKDSEAVDASTPNTGDDDVKPVTGDTAAAAGAEEFDPDYDFTSEEMTAAHAEYLTHQELTGSAVGFGEVESEGDAVASAFEPDAGGLVLGGEVTVNDGSPRLIRFFKASWAELKRVRWPNRQQVAQGTAVTLGFVIIAGVYLGVADYIARQLVNLIL